MRREAEISTIIGRGAECGGNFTAPGSVRIDGLVDGDVTITGTLTVGATGKINGNVSAQAAIIGGEVNGNIVAPDRTELIATARVIGDISTSVIVVDEKAIFQGRCDMNQETPGKKAKLAGRTLRKGRKSAKAAIVEALREMEAADKAAPLFKTLIKTSVKKIAQTL